MKRKKRTFIIVAVVFACILSTAVIAEPGTESDPLISKSYIDDVLMPEIEQMIEERISESDKNSGSVSGDKFVVVEASEGDVIICEAGTELILRMGKANVIATEKGGLADTTSGYDIADGKNMPSNHLLIVPVADGRGIEATTDIIVLIKGGYTIN